MNRKDMSLDLTAMLDIVLIILFAVMLNLSNNSQEATADMKEAKTEYEKALSSLTQVNEAYLQLEESLIESESSNAELTASANRFKEVTETLVDQYHSLLTDLVKLNEDESAQTSQWIKQQESAESYETLVNQLTARDPKTDTNALLENLHKYTVIANKFLMIDAEVDITTGALIFDNQVTEILMTEDDGFDDHLFQLKSKEIATHIGDALDSSKEDFSFVLITIKYDPYITNRYYVSLISDAIERMRDEKEHYIVFETQFLQN